MSEKHFILDVDPDGLRAAATQLAHLSAGLGTKAGKVSGTPAEIGERWVGSAATDVMAEMTALGTVLAGFSTDLGGLPEAVRSLAKDYDKALDRLPELNQKWEQAEQTYQDAVTAAGNALAQGRENAKGDDGTVSAGDDDALRKTRDDAVAGAGDARQTTQHNLEIDFGYLRQWLGQQTRALGEILRESGPLDVPDSAIEAWRNGEGPTIDRAPLFDALVLTKLREIDLVTPDVEEAVEALQDALDDGDQDAVNDALDEIAEHADDPVWSEALARALSPEEMQDLYLQIDEGLKNSSLYIDDIWPHLRGFNETVANGVSQLPDDTFADYLDEWMEKDYGPKMWALLASADSADGRINAAALAHHSEIYNAALNDIGGMPGLFPQVFLFAYPDTDQMEQWADRSSGDDLARILEHMTPEQVDRLLQRMHNVITDGGTMDEDQYQLVADLYNGAIEAMYQHFHDLRDQGKDYNLWPLVTALEAANLNSGRPPYSDMLNDYSEMIVRDPELMAQLIEDAETDENASDIVDLIKRSGVPLDDLIESVTDLHLGQGDRPVSAAAAIGILLRAKDILGDDFKWGGVVNSVLNNVINVAGKGVPLFGPVKDVLSALMAESERLEKLRDDFDDSSERTSVENQLAFALYIQAYGVPPGFEDYIQHQNDSTLSAEQLVNRYIADLRGDADHRGAWDRLNELRQTISETHG